MSIIIVCRKFYNFRKLSRLSQRTNERDNVR